VRYERFYDATDYATGSKNLCAAFQRAQSESRDPRHWAVNGGRPKYTVTRDLAIERQL